MPRLSHSKVTHKGAESSRPFDFESFSSTFLDFKGTFTTNHLKHAFSDPNALSAFRVLCKALVVLMAGLFLAWHFDNTPAGLHWYAILPYLMAIDCLSPRSPFDSLSCHG